MFSEITAMVNDDKSIVLEGVIWPEHPEQAVAFNQAVKDLSAWLAQAQVNLDEKKSTASFKVVIPSKQAVADRAKPTPPIVEPPKPAQLPVLEIPGRPSTKPPEPPKAEQLPSKPGDDILELPEEKPEHPIVKPPEKPSTKPPDRPSVKPPVRPGLKPPPSKPVPPPTKPPSRPTPKPTPRPPSKPAPKRH